MSETRSNRCYKCKYSNFSGTFICKSEWTSQSFFSSRNAKFVNLYFTSNTTTSLQWRPTRSTYIASATASLGNMMFLTPWLTNIRSWSPLVVALLDRYEYHWFFHRIVPLRYPLLAAVNVWGSPYASSWTCVFSIANRRGKRFLHRCSV